MLRNCRVRDRKHRHMARKQHDVVERARNPLPDVVASSEMILRILRYAIALTDQMGRS